MLRGVQLGRVNFYPARPDGDRLRITTQIQVAVWFNAPAGSGLNQVEAAVDPLLEQVKSYVVNPDNVSAWVRSNEQEGVTNRVETVEAKNTAAIEVEQAGIVAISYADLTGISFPLSGVNPANLQLTRDGSSIAYQWEGDGDAVFEADERLLFYAEPRFSRYTQADVYFLTAGSSPGLKMSSRSASPSALPSGVPLVEATFETNDIYTPNCYCGSLPAGRDGDRWVWDHLQKPDRTSVDYPFDLPDEDPSQAANLKLWLIGYTDIPAANPDHKVDVILNGDIDNKLGTIVWDGKQAIAESFQIPANKLLTGENTLTLTLPGIGVNVELVWLDAFQIQYARSSALVGNFVAFSGGSSQHAYTLGLSGNTGLHAYEITNPGEPIILNNLTVSGTVKLGDPAGGGVRRYWVTNQAGIASPSRLRCFPRRRLLVERIT